MYNFGFGGGFGGAPADSDPYADIALDLGSTAKADFSFPFDDAKPKKGAKSGGPTGGLTASSKILIEESDGSDKDSSESFDNFDDFIKNATKPARVTPGPAKRPAPAQKLLTDFRIPASAGESGSAVKKRASESPTGSAGLTGGFGGILRTGAPPGIGRRTSAERVSWSKELAGIREYIKPESPPPAAVGAPTEGDGGGDSSSLSVSMGETIEDEEDEEGGNVFGKIMQWSDFVAQGGMEGADPAPATTGTSTTTHSGQHHSPSSPTSVLSNKAAINIGGEPTPIPHEDSEILSEIAESLLDGTPRGGVNDDEFEIERSHSYMEDFDPDSDEEGPGAGVVAPAAPHHAQHFDHVEPVVASTALGGQGGSSSASPASSQELLRAGGSPKTIVGVGPKLQPVNPRQLSRKGSRELDRLFQRSDSWPSNASSSSPGKGRKGEKDSKESRSSSKDSLLEGDLRLRRDAGAPERETVERGAERGSRRRSSEKEVVGSRERDSSGKKRRTDRERETDGARDDERDRRRRGAARRRGSGSPSSASEVSTDSALSSGSSDHYYRDRRERDQDQRGRRRSSSYRDDGESRRRTSFRSDRRDRGRTRRSSSPAALGGELADARAPPRFSTASVETQTDLTMFHMNVAFPGASFPEGQREDRGQQTGPLGAPRAEPLFAPGPRITGGGSAYPPETMLYPPPPPIPQQHGAYPAYYHVPPGVPALYGGYPYPPGPFPMGGGHPHLSYGSPFGLAMWDGGSTQRAEAFRDAVLPSDAREDAQATVRGILGGLARPSENVKGPSPREDGGAQHDLDMVESVDGDEEENGATRHKASGAPGEPSSSASAQRAVGVVSSSLPPSNPVLRALDLVDQSFLDQLNVLKTQAALHRARLEALNNTVPTHRYTSAAELTNRLKAKKAALFQRRAMVSGAAGGNSAPPHRGSGGGGAGP